jgi:hypothetical protein
MAVNYAVVDALIGSPPLNVSGDATQRIAVGDIVLGRDPLYGIGEFIYVKFTGAAAAGDLLVIDRAAGTCTQSPAAAAGALGRSVGVSMAAQPVGSYGFAMVRGVHDAANVATGTAAGVLLSGSATAGRGATGVANYNLDVATVKTLAAANVATVELYWPVVNGR